MRGTSDNNLLTMWRKASKKYHNHCCFFCGKHESQTQIEVHHYIKRKNLLTRYLPLNGFPVCKYGCHQHAHTKKGEGQIRDWLVKNGWLEYLEKRETQSKQWFVENGITKNDFLKQAYYNLKKVIDG